MDIKVSSESRAISLPDCASDPEEQEVSDDDDDGDRNHKHRRQETGTQSMEGDQQGQFFSGPYRKRGKPFDKGQLSKESQSHYISDREFPPRFEKRRPSMTNFSRFPLDANQGHTSFSGDLGPNRGRSRDSGSWSQYDSRFNQADIASQIVPPGLIPPAVFAGRGLHIAANTQNASWAGGFGLIPRMPNGAIDPIHPLGLQGSLRSPLNPSLNIGIARQRCRDFEERGFCLRGDVCPMEHGVNRIVIEDVQSLSEFNLPVSLPRANLLGNPAGSGLDAHVNASPSVFTNNNGFGSDADGYPISGSPSGAVDNSRADLYDPDQPLWNNDCPQTSTGALSVRPASFIESDPSDQLARSSGAATSVWGRMNASKNRLVSRDKVDSRVTSSDFLVSRTNENHQVYTYKQTAGHHGKQSNTGELVDSSSKLQNHTGHSIRKLGQKALQSLCVNCIPLKDNKKEALLSHFKKFGEVIDIYIPPLTERAFVQFSKREEAERALKSPDAIMGNRFIRLSWANRDSRMPKHMQEKSVPPHPTTANTSKENIQLGIPKVSAPYTSGSSRAADIEGKPSSTNGPKEPTAPPVQKKLENLELLKEELRKKQEMLEQRRKEFRLQLDKLQKNATGMKSEVPEEVQASKKLKVEGSDNSPKSVNPKHSDLYAAGVDKPAEGSLHKYQRVESATLHNFKTKFSAASLELSNLKHAARPLTFVGSPFPANRYKLDNRPTSFRVHAPLPPEFANVDAIRDHFVVFGDLTNVDLENSEVQGDDSNCSETTKNMSACVSFKTRQAAERAFVNGKSWNGHNLQLTWLMPIKSTIISPKDKSPAFKRPSGNSSGERGSSVSTTKEASGTEIQSVEKLACDVSQESCGVNQSSEAQSIDKSSPAGSSLEASGPGSTESEVVEKEGSAHGQMEIVESPKSVRGETQEV